MENFRGLASNREGFPAIFFFFVTRCFELLYNRESFPANNKIMQPRNFYTANDLHYTVREKEISAWPEHGDSPLKIFNNVIRNLLGSWLDSKIPDFILEIPGHRRRKAYVTWLLIYGKWQLMAAKY